MAYEVPTGPEEGSVTGRVKKALSKNRNITEKVKSRLGPGSNKERFKSIAARRMAQGKFVPKGIQKKVDGTQQTGKPMYPGNKKIFHIPEDKKFQRQNPPPTFMSAGGTKEPREKQPEASPEDKKAAHLAAFKAKINKGPRRRS